MACPCGSGQSYETCCEPFHKGTALPETAEKLMRSRYSAFVTQNIGYLKDTTWPAFQKRFDEAGYLDRAANSIWLGLEIVAKETGGANDQRGHVTFIAKSMIDANIHQQREKSLFRKKGGRWYYVEPVAE